jgi:hypothetical protein
VCYVSVVAISRVQMIHSDIVTCRSASYRDLHFEIDHEGRLRTNLYDKRDDFVFFVVNFTFICSNIPAAPAYGEYISLLIRDSRTCGSYHNFPNRELLLTRKQLYQWFLLVKLKSSLRKFYGRYGISVSQMTTDMFRSFPQSWLVTGCTCGTGATYPSGAPEFTSQLLVGFTLLNH